MKGQNSMKKDTRNEKDFLEDDYISLDISSSTECTGMVPTPPLTEAEVEGLSSIYSVPQQKVSMVDEDGKKKKYKK